MIHFIYNALYIRDLKVLQVKNKNKMSNLIKKRKKKIKIKEEKIKKFKNI